MSRKRLLLLATPTVAALAAAGAALAGQGGPNSQAVSATISATTVSHAKLTTCQINNSDTFAATIATYTGTATSSDPRLSGKVTIRAASLIDTDTGVGRVVGLFRITNGSNAGAHGSINAAVGSGKET
jgi:hypothetical protein